MYREWHASYVPSTHPACISCCLPKGNKPPPFIRGVLAHGNCCLFSAGVQVSTGHAFTSSYSLQFRPGAGDNTACPCSTPLREVPHTAAHVILDCPQHDAARLTSFGTRTPSLTHVFGTYAGGHALAKFLWSTHDLLQPLPPRTIP